MTTSNDKVCDVTDKTLLEELGKNAAVECARCGARSHDKTNVCEPVAIEADH